MANIVVVADDLTGSNATGVLLKKNGLKTHTVLHAEDATNPLVQDSDCIVISTNSRAIPSDEAYQEVSNALTPLISSQVVLYSKRIDSTLRGNLGSETDAFLDLLGEDWIAVCVPCFPSSGRILVGGQLLVAGVPLKKTAVAKDPKCPITTSSAEKLFVAQSKYGVASIGIDDIAEGSEALRDQFLRLRADGKRIIICDSIVSDDMETIADALMLSGIPFVPVDPGVFTAICAKKKLATTDSRKDVSKLLCVIGSVNEVAIGQTYELLKAIPHYNVILQVRELLESEERRAAEIERALAELIAHADDGNLLSLIGSGINPAERLSFEFYMQRDGVDMETISDRVAGSFAEIAYRIFEQVPGFKGIYSTGGDITAAINARFGTIGLRLFDEVVPLAGYGELVGGRFPGLRFISKGGMVGDEKAMVTCVNYLREHL